MIKTMSRLKTKANYKDDLINLLGSLLINIDQNYKKQDAGYDFVMDLEDKAAKLKHYVLEHNETVINMLYVTLLDSINFMKSDNFRVSPYENKMMLVSRIISTLNEASASRSVSFLEDAV